ncbi:MAG: Hsp33 family molecular chaperone HslO [Lachnospiraceae bacterium]|nr:Hsp33 family molecular chaperone HslO [Lachnospiraceae bacterium]MDY4970654.1 Hsp33 family molecular chaperone HslO [Lachnospiraceae bacterium]
MSDYLVRATAADNSIRAFAATTKDLVEHARQVHNTSPVATAALGRLMTAGVMMGSMMKGDDDLITLQIKGDGPIEGIVVTADSHGGVKGYVYNPEVLIHANAKGKLDVAGAVGKGELRVIRDTGLKDPYVGTIELVSGEIAEDITYYFAASEQIPSAVALGVLMDRANYVKQAGGLIIQLMPFAPDELVDKLEQKIAQITSLTSLLDQGMTPEQILEFVLGDLGLEIMDKMPLEFSCNCSRERVEKAVISTGAAEMQDMIDEGKTIEVNCHFCGKKYEFSVEDLKGMLKRATRP